ncbi:hypothetical protein COP2_035081 [Malus domestica]
MKQVLQSLNFIKSVKKNIKEEKQILYLQVQPFHQVFLKLKLLKQLERTKEKELRFNEELRIVVGIWGLDDVVLI